MKVLLAIVGMPGAGKSGAVSYIQKKGIPFVRFGQVTDEGLRAQGLTLTPENEKAFRENLRAQLGMAAYAIASKSKIEELLKANAVVVIDGLYSWEEYLFLKKEFPNLLLIHVYAEPQIRYKRLSERLVRPISFEKSRERDMAEIENLNKGGPIAIADYLIDNNSSNIQDLYKKIDELLDHLKIEKYD
ncbi:MAG: AAA family ATPase [Candidatus Levybacteria bacterium]|nr:AAA family ATPase [Candidatus Levybacteria bacterium]